VVIDIHREGHPGSLFYDIVINSNRDKPKCDSRVCVHVCHSLTILKQMY